MITIDQCEPIMQPHRELEEKMKKVVDEDALKMEEGRKRMEIYFV